MRCQSCNSSTYDGYDRLTCVSPEFISRHVVIAALRSNLPFFAVGCVILVAGVWALLLARLRSRDTLLLWLGIFSVLYAGRLLIRNELVRAAFRAPGLEYLPWALCITYVIPIPYALFVREWFGRGWHGVIVIWLWLEVAFAIVAIPIALLAHQVRWTDSVNGLLVIGGTLLVLLHVLFSPEGSDPFAKSLTYPLLISGTLVVLENRGIRPAGVSMEPFGFLVLLGGLGMAAARRTLTRERKLVEVEQELVTARRIQNSIIPHASPDVRYLRIATRYQPMTSVAGDFYDFLKTGEHCLTILVADVSGHGVPAALVSSMLKVCFAAQREQAHNPAGILSGLNVMLRDCLGGQFVTAACAAIDVAEQAITYSGAGHPPSLLLRKNTGSVMQLAENGLFIGPFPHAAYSNIVVPFESGDKLLLYTDGIVEATGSDGQEFGQERLEQLLGNAEDPEPAEFIEQLFRKISTPVQEDDLTVVLAQFE
jgi:phosphoserine phosphatase RsbU/P